MPAANFDLTETIRELEQEMVQAANNLEFEKQPLSATRSGNSSE